MDDSVDSIRYIAPPVLEGAPHCLVHTAKAGESRRFSFDTEIEIGRCCEEPESPPGRLRIDDAAISRRHCVVTRGEDGRFFVRDLSLNGTWLDGRRLTPGLENEIRPGQEIRLGNGMIFRLEGEGRGAQPNEAAAAPATVAASNQSLVTILVGDIRGYTELTRQAPVEALQRSIQRVFRKLESVVARHGGATKEYQGDAILAYWDYGTPGRHAESACRAALALDAEAARMAQNPELWDVPGFRLGMDWAITTGLVSTQSFRSEQVAGLSMIGEPLVLAFRLEKEADERTGPILVCATTRIMVGEQLPFRDVGHLALAGFDKPVRAYALLRRGDDKT